MRSPIFIAAALFLTALLPGCCKQHPASFADIAPDPVPVHPENGPFLFCYFYGNGDGLHLAYSTDGLRMVPLNNDKIYMLPTVANGLMRDPCVRQGPDGMYHLVWTSGWWDNGFGVASSPDLVHWSTQQNIQVNKNNPTAINTWAPELFYDDKTQNWMIFWATTIPGKFAETEVNGGKGTTGPNKNQSMNHRIYYVMTRDFATYTEPKLLVDPGFNCIDATLMHVPEGSGALTGKYLMVIKDETAVPVPRKNLRVMTADAAEGPWSKASEPITMDWVEGPSIARVGDSWYVYYDEYRNNNYGAVRTKDFKTFEVVKENFSFPKNARHGTVFPVTQGTLERLKNAALINIPIPPPSTQASHGPSVPKLPETLPATAPGK